MTVCCRLLRSAKKKAINKIKKKLHWQEARLALVHEQGSVTPKLDATFGASVNDAGQALLNCAVAAGFGTQTHLYGVGDGAFWIADQTCAKFGTQTRYLADFSMFANTWPPPQKPVPRTSLKSGWKLRRAF